MEKKMEDYYLSILKEEMLLAMGCTEPIAVAYAAAAARSLLQHPESITSCALYVSGNIIKNAKSVVVPNTGGMKGLEAAAAAGIAAGKEKAGLQVLAEISQEQKEAIQTLLHQCAFQVLPANGPKIFYIEVQLKTPEETARAVIEDFHTNLVLLEHNGKAESIHRLPCGEARTEEPQTDRSHMSVQGILDFAAQVELEKTAGLIERQIRCNTAISEEGLKNPWGAQVGQTMLKGEAVDVYTRAAAAAAAGSDARMSGCELPVAIVSGSGNQGLTASMPVIVYARETGASEEKLHRALLVSNLITIHQKTSIGRLSAFCGATSAGVGAACGIAWLDGGGYEEISHTIVNALAVLSGMVCDGAKPSCAAKIAMAVNNGIFGYRLYRQGLQFYAGDGIVTKGVENTIANVGRLANRGMRMTDGEILDMMVGK